MNQENAILAAANAVLSNFTQQIVEQATNPLVKRIATLERQQEELYDIIKVSLNEFVNNAVKHAIESPEHSIWVSVLKGNILDEVDHKISSAFKSASETKIVRVVEEHLQNQSPLEADDIDGLDKFVRDVISDVQDDDDGVRDKVRDALRLAADSI
jgi:two-component sensor histidine kinase